MFIRFYSCYVFPKWNENGNKTVTIGKLHSVNWSYTYNDINDNDYNDDDTITAQYLLISNLICNVLEKCINITKLK